MSSKKDKSEKPPPRPVDVSDGIPDRAESPSRRRLVLALVIFAAWIAVLLYFLLAARV